MQYFACRFNTRVLTQIEHLITVTLNLNNYHIIELITQNIPQVCKQYRVEEIKHIQIRDTPTHVYVCVYMYYMCLYMLYIYVCIYIYMCVCIYMCVYECITFDNVISGITLS